MSFVKEPSSKKIKSKEIRKCILLMNILFYVNFFEYAPYTIATEVSRSLEM